MTDQPIEISATETSATETTATETTATEISDETPDAGRVLAAAAHLGDMTSRKPALPPRSHITISLAVTEALAGSSPEDVDSLPAKVRESLDYFTEVADIAESINGEQPQALKEYRDEFVQFVRAQFPAPYDVDLGPEESETHADERAASAVDAIFSSHLMARLLADVAVGNIEPVATVTKTTKPKATPAAGPAPKTDPAPVGDPGDPTDKSDGDQGEPAGPDENEGSAAKPTGTGKARTRARTRKSQAAAASAGEVAPAPSADDFESTAAPVPDTSGSDDFDDEPNGPSEPVLPPDPEDIPPARPAPRGAPPAGVRPLTTVPDDDDF